MKVLTIVRCDCPRERPAQQRPGSVARIAQKCVLGWADGASREQPPQVASAGIQDRTPVQGRHRCPYPAVCYPRTGDGRPSRAGIAVPVVAGAAMRQGASRTWKRAEFLGRSVAAFCKHAATTCRLVLVQVRARPLAENSILHGGVWSGWRHGGRAAQGSRGGGRRRRLAPWRGRSVRPDGRVRCRQACAMRYGVVQWANRPEDSDASQAIHPVVAWLASRGAGRRIGAPAGAVQHGGGGNCQGAASAGSAVARGDVENCMRPNGPQHTRCGRGSTGGRNARETVVAAGARGSRQVEPRLGSATVDVATLLHASKHFGPRGFPQAALRRENECVVRLSQVFPSRNLGGGPCLRSFQRD